LTLALVLSALAPSVCLVWFMSQATRNERLVAREKLAEAYRGHLALAQERLENYWRQMAAELETAADNATPGQAFAKVVRSGMADAAVCFDTNGAPSYPSPAVPPRKTGRDSAWEAAARLEIRDAAGAAAAFEKLAARATGATEGACALQAEARCLAAAGKRDEALRILAEVLPQEKYRTAADDQGRLIAPSAELRAVEILKETDAVRAGIVFDDLGRRLNDYRMEMPSAQRRFLMGESRRMFPGRAKFATLPAEEMAARYEESGSTVTRGPTLHASGLPGVWQFGSARGRVVGLYGIEALRERMRAAASSPALPSDVRLDFAPPGSDLEKYFLSAAGGPSAGGWRAALALKDQRLFEATANQQIAANLWIGLLSLAGAAILGALAVGLARRQVALTRLKNDLVANVTHELKTPLSSMRLLVDTLLESERLDEKTAREYLGLIAQENARLSRLIDNFLAFSRIERNKFAFDFKETTAGALVAGAVAAAGERFHAPGCRLETTVQPGLPPVAADLGAVVTALVNLLDNAWKYTGDAKEVALEARAENGWVCFSVRDNGVGLAARDSRRVFDRFYQADSHLSRAGGGCGLGLSIVKFVVEAHGGEARVQSEPGRGSVFTLALPARGKEKT
jgi:signal transduction histidine kinase